MAIDDVLQAIALQERDLVFDRFDEDIAWALGSLLRGMAKDAGWRLVIDIRHFHQALFFAAMAGSAPDNIDWARRKRNVVERFHRSSYAMGLEMAKRGSTLESRYGLPLVDFAEHGGAFPIRVAQAGVVGCVTVSGLPQREDHMLVVDALCAIQGKDRVSLPCETRTARRPSER